MATSSFDKQFIIEDFKVAQEFLNYLDDPNTPKIEVKKTDLKEDEEIGLLLLEKLH